MASAPCLPPNTALTTATTASRAAAASGLGSPAPAHTKGPTILAHMHKALLSSITSSSGVWLGNPSSCTHTHTHTHTHEGIPFWHTCKKHYSAASRAAAASGLGSPAPAHTHTHKKAYHFGTHAQSITQQHHKQQRRLAWGPQLLNTQKGLPFWHTCTKHYSAASQAAAASGLRTPAPAHTHTHTHESIPFWHTCKKHYSAASQATAPFDLGSPAAAEKENRYAASCETATSARRELAQVAAPTHAVSTDQQL